MAKDWDSFSQQPPPHPLLTIGAWGNHSFSLCLCFLTGKVRVNITHPSLSQEFKELLCVQCFSVLLHHLTPSSTLPSRSAWATNAPLPCGVPLQWLADHLSNVAYYYFKYYYCFCFIISSGIFSLLCIPASLQPG